jgi:type I restriction enzyme S subunit
MNWLTAQIRLACLSTETTDPTKDPEGEFDYIDISGIDRKTKCIVSTSRLRGNEAPSRARKLVQFGDTLVSTVRPNLNAVAMVPESLSVQIASTGFCVLRANEKLVDRRFLFFYTRSDGFIRQLLRNVRGASYPAVTDRNVFDSIIPLPVRSEQRQIVEILDRSDVLCQLKAESERMIQRILPALFHKHFGSPDCWDANGQVVPLSNLVTPRGGGTPSKMNAEFWGGDTPWVSPKDMKRDFISDAEDHITLKAVRETVGELIPVNSILVVVRGMILTHSVPIAITEREVAINQDMKALTITDDRISPQYLFASLRALHPRILASVSTAAHGTQKLDTDRLLSMPILIPDPEKHKRFVKWFEDARAILDGTAQSLPRVEKVFEVLLHRAFTGELTAKWRANNRKMIEIEMREQLNELQRAKSKGSTTMRGQRQTEGAKP